MDVNDYVKAGQWCIDTGNFDVPLEPIRILEHKIKDPSLSKVGRKVISSAIIYLSIEEACENAVSNADRTFGPSICC